MAKKVNMDALELQAALVKLDPATTVTPIGSNMRILSHNRIAFGNIDNVDEDVTTLHNSQQNGCANPQDDNIAQVTTTKKCAFGEIR